MQPTKDSNALSSVASFQKNNSLTSGSKNLTSAGGVVPKKKNLKSVISPLQALQQRVVEGTEIRDLHQNLILIDCSSGQKTVRECVNTQWKKEGFF